MGSAPSLCGTYFGRKRVREHRKDELSPTERKELERSKGAIQLAVRVDGTFRCDLTDGRWRQLGDTLTLTPTAFGGETCEAMKQRAEAMGRVFALAFLFKPFELRLRGGALVTTDEEALIYTEFRPVAT